MLSVRPRLYSILKERGITQNELSKMSNVPQPTISRFGRNQKFHANHLFAISKALNLRIEDLFEEVDE